LELTRDQAEMPLTLSFPQDAPEELDLRPRGIAPEFTGIVNWLNSEALTMQELRGKVVLIDFWTYSCINCIRTLPFLKDWYEKYSDQGLVIVGVHTPEFNFEKKTSNVEAAIKRFAIDYPVAQDNDYGTWRAYNNRFWPAKYLVNQEGQVVYTHFGEGAYEQTENAIRTLLGLNVAEATAEDASPNVRTPEIYTGTLRLEFFASPESPVHTPTEFSYPEDLPVNTFALQGLWEFDDEFTALKQSPGGLKLDFFSGKVHMVAQAPEGESVRVNVFLDGKLHRELIIGESKLYDVVDTEKYQGHVLELQILDAGLEIFAFTFG